MNITSIDPTVWSAVLVVGRVTVLLGAAAGLQWLFRRRMSAATSHLVWTIAIGGILLLPLASMVAPSWALVVRTEPRVSQALPDRPCAQRRAVNAVDGSVARAYPPQRPDTGWSRSQPPCRGQQSPYGSYALVAPRCSFAWPCSTRPFAGCAAGLRQSPTPSGRICSRSVKRIWECGAPWPFSVPAT